MKLHFHEQGAGLPLVLIHGFPLDHTLWLPQLHGLSDVARVIAPDLRGFGNSPATRGTVTMEQHARDVGQLMDRLGIERAVIGGLSMGGYVALAFAELFPERLAGLVLCNTRAVADGGPARKTRETVARRAIEEGMAALAPIMVHPLLADVTRKARPDLIGHLEAMIGRQDPAGVAASSRGMAIRPDRTPLLGQVQVPALVITGSSDTLIAPAESEAMTARLPKGQLVSIPDVGHLSCLEAPEAFNRAVHGLLGQVA
ncbi:MAG: alpha/beta fold hydrolase [Flavobacteriales bacterium]|nr:3-oxoadipate enol-lactonase 2 [Flavobacteriales bacterium]MCC6578699.1 alpha/beta fold hydrolase [Flavobacteriales bacterium]NUQ16436.1 alpha/beta fold hydrolase [Flavobacteriales bacterium]